MVIIRSHLGEINISRQFFAQLIGGTLTNCFGVIGTNAGNARQTIMESLPFAKKKTYIDKGVTVKIIRGRLVIDLHITVMYGVNISSVVKSIQHKIAYVINEETDLDVEAVNVFVDGIKS